MESETPLVSLLYSMPAATPPDVALFAAPHSGKAAAAHAASSRNATTADVLATTSALPSGGAARDGAAPPPSDLDRVDVERYLEQLTSSSLDRIKKEPSILSKEASDISVHSYNFHNFII